MNKKMVTRREFLKKAGIAVASTAVMPSIDFALSDIKTGLILYTVRDDMLKDPDGTLKAVADMGYNWVEAASYSKGLFYNQKPADFRRKVESFGLKLISSHSGVNTENIDKAVEDAAEAGMEYMVLPSLPVRWRKSLDSYKETADFFNLAGEKCKSAGIKFGFHNHSIEFKKIDNQIPYDLLVLRTDSKLVIFELDLCWITAGGQSAVEYINKYPGRFELWHMKDMSADKRDATMGEGTIDFKPIFALTEKAGMKYFFVEQDNCRTHTPLDSAKISRNFLLKNM
jgi:sugar phosphate isomerase/epimerase